MKTKSKNGMENVFYFFILVLFFAGLLLAGCHQAGGQIHISKENGTGQALCADNRLSDTAVSEQRSCVSSLSFYRKQGKNLWDFKSKIFIDSFWAILFRMVLIPCIFFRAFHYTKNADTLLQRIICGFIHLQDGKKKQAFSY